ncbi:Mei2-like protein [Gracilaria domingensis]|nr:Mei2-like protein [Gracilaria domingensis]
MVDQWPSRVAAPTTIVHDDPQGVAGIAALSPQFDLAVSPARRSVPPIGSLSPQRAFLSSFSSPQKHSHHPFVQNPFSQITPPPPHPLPAADLLAEGTHSAELLSAAATLLDDPSNPPTPDFDLFGIAKLDLGPSVKPAVSSPSNLITPFHSTAFDLPFSTSPPPTSYPIAPQSAPPPSTSPRRDAAHPTRCVQLRNIPPGIDDDDIRRVLTKFGPLRDLGAQQRSRGGHGSVLATYYDLRHARAAVRALDSSVHFGRCLDARFQCPIDLRSSSPVAPNAQSSAPCANQGTLVVFNLDCSTSAEDIRSLFSSVGDVKEIRATPNKKHHKFVEFYDVRDAERAMHLLNKTEVAGKRIKIEISRPGGRAANMSRTATHQSSKIHANANNTASSNANGLMHRSRSHFSNAPQSHLDADSFRASPRHGMGTSSPVLQASPMRTSSPFNHHRIPTTQAPPFAIPSPEVSFDIPSFDAASPLSPRMRSMLTPSGFDATNALAGSLEKTFVASRSVDGIEVPVLHGLDSIPESRPYQAMYSSEHPELSRVAGKVVHPPASQKPVRDTYMQALYHSPPCVEDSRSGVISPPIDSAAVRSQYGAIGAGNGAQRNNSSDMEASSAFHQPSYADTIVANTGMRSNANNANPSAHASRKIGNGSGGERPTNASHRHSNSSKSNSHANGHGRTYVNHHQVNSKYVLDIGKVRSGDEMRTALMIRNIPNKYNQKMLLSTLEDEHKGHFDFIYLPIDFKNKCNVGYAFINFTKPEYIEPFYNAFHGKKWGRFNSEKVCEITFARIQGRQQLIAHFQNSSLLLEDPKCRPVIFDSSGRQEEFPIGSHVRTRRGPSSRDASHRSCDGTPPFSPTKHRGRS